MINWEVIDKDIDYIVESVKIGLEDASPKAREVARTLFYNLNQLFPKRADKIKNSLPLSIQQKLDKTEGEIVQRLAVENGEDFLASEGSNDSLSPTENTHPNKHCEKETFIPQEKQVENSVQQPITPKPIKFDNDLLNISQTPLMSATKSTNKRKSVIKNPFEQLTSSTLETPILNKHEPHSSKHIDENINHTPLHPTTSFSSYFSSNSTSATPQNKFNFKQPGSIHKTPTLQGKPLHGSSMKNIRMKVLNSTQKSPPKSPDITSPHQAINHRYRNYISIYYMISSINFLCNFFVILSKIL